jgi:hypothetical protein
LEVISQKGESEMEYFIGKRVQIIGNHPWSGERGTVKETKTIPTGTTGLIIELDNGTSCFVFKASQLQILKS